MSRMKEHLQDRIAAGTAGIPAPIDTGAEAPTQRLVVLGPNLTGVRTTFVVHAEGCADLNRGPNRMQINDHFRVEAASRVEVCDAAYPPGDFRCESGDYLDDFHFAPCVHLPESSR